jgi:Predicted membrane protein
MTKTLRKLTQTGLVAALCFAAFTFLKIPIPLPGGATALHIGNAFCVLGALLLGGWYGGLAGAIGMSIADILDPVFITSAPQTFFLKLCIGLVTGFVAHKIAKINKTNNKTHIWKWSLLASIAGLGFNVIFAPIVSYLYKTYILGQPGEIAQVLARIGAVATLVNAIVSVVLVTVLYRVLRPILVKTGNLEVEVEE